MVFHFSLLYLSTRSHLSCVFLLSFILPLFSFLPPPLLSLTSLPPSLVSLFFPPSPSVGALSLSFSLSHSLPITLSQVKELSVALQEKSDWCSELLLRVEQLQRDVQERNEEIERQEERVRVLEEVLVSHDNHSITGTRVSMLALQS